MFVVRCRYANSVTVLTVPSKGYNKTVHIQYMLTKLCRHKCSAYMPYLRIVSAYIFGKVGDFRCGVPLFIVILVIYKYENRY